MKDRPSKMTRQLWLYDHLVSHTYHGPDEMMTTFNISRRMLQRDLKDLRDSGLIDVRYDKTSDNYVDSGQVSFDETATGRHRQHLIRLHRLGTLLSALSPTDMEVLRRYESEYGDYVYYRDVLVKEDPIANPPEDIGDPPKRPELPNLKEEYYTLFPDSNERTRQRDFEELSRAGFLITYDRKYRAFIYDTGSDDA